MFSQHLVNISKPLVSKLNYGSLYYTRGFHYIDLYRKVYSQRLVNLLTLLARWRTNAHGDGQLHILSSFHYGTMSTEAGSSSMSMSTHSTASHMSEMDTVMMNEAKEIFYHAVNSVLPHQMIGTRLQYESSSSVLRVEGREYKLQSNVHIVGFGKAVLGMARAVEDCIGQHIVRGLISIPVGAQEAFVKEGKKDMLLQPDSKIQVIEGAENNLPDEAALGAATQISAIAEEVREGDVLIVLISGGGSALLPAPKPPVSLSDMLTVTQVMSKAGASIMDLNTVRKQIDVLKGGGLAKLAQPAKVISLILSDVIGDPLDFIASGPTVPDQSTPQECLDLFVRLDINKSVPRSVLSLLQKEVQQQGSKASDGTNSHQKESKIRTNVDNILVGTNKIACDAASKKSSIFGYSPFILSTGLDGDAGQVGKMFSLLAQYIILCFDSDSGSVLAEDLDETERTLKLNYLISPEKLQSIKEFVKSMNFSEGKGACLVAGGETTVNVHGNGKGGRNQEMVVTAALELHKQFSKSQSCLSKPDNILVSSKEASPVNVVFLSAGTDGQDGPTLAAGGVVSIGFVSQAEAANANVLDYLERNDTNTLLCQVNNGSNLVMTGLTGTNVMDIHLLLIRRA